MISQKRFEFLGYTCNTADDDPFGKITQAVLQLKGLLRDYNDQGKLDGLPWARLLPDDQNFFTTHKPFWSFLISVWEDELDSAYHYTFLMLEVDVADHSKVPGTPESFRRCGIAEIRYDKWEERNDSVRSGSPELSEDVRLFKVGGPPTSTPMSQIKALARTIDVDKFEEKLFAGWTMRTIQPV